MASEAHKRLLPFQQRDENDIINIFSLTNTGERGQLVSVSSANLDDKHGWDYGNSPGKTHNGTASFRYDVKLKVRPATSGDTKYNVLGIQLYDVAEFDENGEQYQYYPQKAIENHTVISGKAVPVATKGLFAISSKGWANPTGNIPQIGDVAVSADNGLFYFADPDVEVADSGAAFVPDNILGKVLATGSKQGGYVFVKIDI